MSQVGGQSRLVDLLRPGPGRRPRRSARRFCACTSRSIMPLAGPVSKASSSPSAAHQGDVADAAEVQHRDRRGSARTSAPGRRDRPGASGAPCPPAATSAVRKSKATGRPRPSASRWASIELDRAAPGALARRRLVQHRLAVEADEIEIRGGEADARPGTPRPPARCSRRWRRAALAKIVGRRRIPRPGQGRGGRPPAQRAVSGASLRSPAGPKPVMASPSVSSTAMSTASSEVPVMKPRTRMAALTAMATAR